MIADLRFHATPTAVQLAAMVGKPAILDCREIGTCLAARMEPAEFGGSVVLVSVQLHGEAERFALEVAITRGRGVDQ